MLPLALMLAATPAELEAQRYSRQGACFRDLAACVAASEAECAAGDPVGCALLVTARRAPEDRAIAERICREAGLVCDLAAQAEGSVDGARRWFGVGCEAGSAYWCYKAAVAWLPPEPEADRREAIAAYDRGCALGEETLCISAARERLHLDDRRERARGEAALEAAAIEGSAEAIATLVAVRYGGPEHLPAPLQEAWDLCAERRPQDLQPRWPGELWVRIARCPALGAALVAAEDR